MLYKYIICSGNGLVPPIRQQAIIWTSDGQEL